MPDNDFVCKIEKQNLSIDIMMSEAKKAPHQRL